MKRLYIYRTLFSILIFFLAGHANSQHLDDYLFIAAKNNPGLKAKFNEYQAALERAPQVGSLPDPQLSFGIFIKPMQRFTGNQVAEISLMQMFPWYGTLSEAKNEASLMAKAKFESFNEAKSLLFYEVKATWNVLYLLEKEIGIAEENIRILKMLEQIAISRFVGGGEKPQGSAGMKTGEQMESSVSSGDMNTGQAGMNAMGTLKEDTKSNTSTMNSMVRQDIMGGGGSMVDVLRVQIELNELYYKLALLKDSKQPLLAQFNKLLNRTSGEVVMMPDNIPVATLPAQVSEIPDSIRLNSPMLKMLEKEEEAFMAQGNMNRKMGFPMIGVGLQYSIFRPREGNQSMMNGKNMLMPMATISIPLWRKKYNAAVQEAGFMQEAVIEQRRDVSNQLMVSYEEAIKDYKDAHRRIELYQQQTALAQQVLNLLTVQYTTAGSDFEEVLRMQQQLLEYRLKGLDARVDGHVAVAMLERLMGR
ncbi:MAG: TolC family protein [Bacteroidales bacterium]|nr:TolC family protein [Bacteroidales bacterium]MDZ4203640.1 TolC family protein [Bacteroidales bacterium]